MKYLISLIGLSVSMTLGILVMIHGYGLEVVSWPWIIWGNLGASMVGAVIINGSD